MSRKAIISVFVSVLCLLPLNAQVRISGNVADDRGEPVIGAAVLVDGLEGVGTTVNAEGYYILELPASVSDQETITLRASALGYDDAVRKVRDPKSSKEVDFVLKENSESLNTVVVTATRTPKLLKDVPIITRVITAREIERADAIHIGELLESELPGIEFSYSMNQQISMNLQGFGGNSVLFLVDGERIAGETLDNIDYNRLNLDNVERVEIVKGAASSLYGSNAVGGVVNIISAMPTDPWSAKVSARYSTLNEWVTSASTGFRLKKFSNLISASYVDSDAVQLKNDGVYSQIYGGYNYNIKEHFIYEPVRGLKITGKAGYYFRQRDSSEDERDRYRDFSANLKGDYEINENSNITVSYNFDQYDKSALMTAGWLDIREYSNVQHNVRALYSYTFGDGLHNLIAGGDFMRDYLLSYQFEDGDHSQYTGDLFFQYDSNPTEWFNIVAGLRGDYYSESSLYHISPKLGLMFKLDPFNIRASYAGGFRAPTLKEMYMSFDMASIFMIYGNADLVAEQSDNFSLSLEWINRRYNLTVTGYYNLVDNKITTAWSEALGGMVYTNISPMRVTGADLNFSGSYDFGLKFRLSYTYTNEHVQDGEPLTSATRPHSATLKVDYWKDWRKYGFDVSLTGKYMSGVTAAEYTSLTDYTQTEEQFYPGYTMWKLVLTQRIWKGTRLSIVVDNLFNYVPDYYYSNSPTTIGRTYSFGLSLDLYEMFH